MTRSFLGKNRIILNQKRLSVFFSQFLGLVLCFEIQRLEYQFEVSKALWSNCKMEFKYASKSGSKHFFIQPKFYSELVSWNDVFAEEESLLCWASCWNHFKTCFRFNSICKRPPPKDYTFDIIRLHPVQKRKIDQFITWMLVCFDLKIFIFHF